MATTYRLSYYPWLTQHVAANEIRRQIERFAREVEGQLSNIKIVVLAPLEVDKQINLLVGGGCEIALMNPLGYVFARRRGTGTVESIAIAKRIIDGKVGDEYFAQVYTRKTTALRKDDPHLAKRLAGRSIGYGVPYSTSNFLIPAYELLQRGTHPFTAFSRMEFLGGHDLVAKAVYEGRVDVGAGHDGVIIDLANQYGSGDATDRLVTLIRSAPIPSDPVVTSLADATAKKDLQTALVRAGATPDGKDALERFWGKVQGLGAIAGDRYEVLVKSLDTLKLTEADLLPHA